MLVLYPSAALRVLPAVAVLFFAGAGLAQRWNRRSQNVKYGIQIEVEHALKRGVVGVRDRLATGETTDRVRQNIELSETLHNLIYQGLGALSG